ncbi:MAG: hypothetical protein ACK5LC_08695, partial [Coprobacillaceae bacterium]
IIEPEGLVGNTTYNDGESIYHINNTRSKQAYVSANDYPERVEIMLSSFMNNYRNKTKEFSKIGEATEGQYIVLDDYGIIGLSNIKPYIIRVYA